MENGRIYSLASSSQTKSPSNSGDKDDKILEDLINSVQKDNFSVAGVLRGCKVEKFDSGELVLSTNFKFYKERLSDIKVVDLIEKKLFDITNDKIKITIV